MMTKTERDIQRNSRILRHATQIDDVSKACRYFGVANTLQEESPLARLNAEGFETKTNGQCRRSHARVQPDLRPAWRTTLPHLSVSDAMNLPKSAGVPGAG